jgi:putative colanic acid biosynthesis UDP-glucose lipid carrier transferase
VLGAAGLVFLAPLLVTLALWVRLDSPGPALFRQRRTGLNGRVFVIYKLRTMAAGDPPLDADEAGFDPARVTGPGRFLRRASLDELPQLINVLRGEMSLVGPRPHAVVHDRHFGRLLPAYADRFRTRPGLTGLAQVSGRRGPIRTLGCMAARVGDDNAYIDGWSIRADLRILARTLPSLLRDPPVG